MCGTMADNTKGNTETIKSMDSVFIHGQMAEAMKDTGGWASSMV